MLQLQNWFRSWVPDSVKNAGGGRSSVEALFCVALDIEEVLSLSVADVFCPLTLLIGVFWIWSCVVLACQAVSVMLIFEYHAHVRLRFKLAAGLGKPWHRDGGCPLSMMFIVALCLPWCMYLAAQEVWSRSCMLIILSVSRDPLSLLRAAEFTTGHVRLVGQELAPRKCVLLSTSRVVRKDMKRPRRPRRASLPLRLAFHHVLRLRLPPHGLSELSLGTVGRPPATCTCQVHAGWLTDSEEDDLLTLLIEVDLDVSRHQAPVGHERTKRHKEANRNLTYERSHPNTQTSQRTSHVEPSVWMRQGGQPETVREKRERFMVEKIKIEAKRMEVPSREDIGVMDKNEDEGAKQFDR